jgi:hypothetical protein
MKTNCAAFVEEFAAFVSDSAELSAEAAAHVKSCAHCRERVAALKAVAAMHRAAAARLAEPTRQLGRQRLKEALATSGRRRPGVEMRWRAVLAGASALALILGAVLIDRMLRGRANSGFQARQPQSTWQAGAEPSEPTLQILRREVEGNRELLLAGTTGAALRPYRLKDAIGVRGEQ